MKMTSGLFVLLSVVAFTMANNDLERDQKQKDKPVNSDCKSNDECAPGNCCLLSGFLNSTPSCRPMRAKGEMCRMGEPLLTSESFTLGGKQYKMTGVHRTVCPCAKGLACAKVKEEPQCQVAH